MTAVASLVVLVPVGFGVVRGQEQPTPPGAAPQSFEPAPDLPRFEVSTVKPTSERDDRRTMMMTPDGQSLRGIPLQMVLRQAFGVEDDRIIGAPGWTKSSRWDIEAKVSPEDAPKLEKLKVDQRREMLLPLLVERFNLKYHVEQREIPTYALVIAKGGPKLTETKPDDTGTREFPGPNGGPTPRGMVRMGAGRIDAHGGGIEFLTHALSPMLGRTVLDKTGLTGKYDFTLHWTPDPGMMPMRGPGGDGGPAHGDSATDEGGPSIFTAVEEQLGLKLESQKSKVDVIVIDHIDLPSEN